MIKIFNSSPTQEELFRTAVFGVLWGIVEITIGTVLHSAKIPFRGTIISLIVVCLITCGRNFAGYRGATLTMGAIAASLKILAGTGFNITPFAAIIFEALTAEIIFSAFGYRKVSALLTGAFVMLYTLSHGFIMQGIFLGFDVYKIYVRIIRELSSILHIDGYPILMIAMVIIIFYAGAGMFSAFIGLKIATRTKEIILRMENEI
jgi:ABC-type thiamin/hydroxymethylpyrimidine transport system permease subunit